MRKLTKEEVELIKRVIEEAKPKEYKCICGCNFGDGCLCKEERDGYNRAIHLYQSNLNNLLK